MITKERYFLFTYAGLSPNNKTHIGAIGVCCNKMPYHLNISSAIDKEIKSLREVEVISLFEFKDENDYRDFFKMPKSKISFRLENDSDEFILKTEDSKE